MEHNFVYIALGLNSCVVAIFKTASDCTAFCKNGTLYTDMPFNLNNRDGEPAPLVGTFYRA